MNQNQIDYKTLQFVTQSLTSTAHFDFKSAAAVWDPNINHFRCPVGTRNGGKITNRTGSNCGGSIAKRVIRSIAQGAQPVNKPKPARANVLGRLAARGAGMAGRAADRLDRTNVPRAPKAPSARAVPKRRRGMAERAAERVGRAADRLDATGQAEGRVEPRRRRGVAERMADRVGRAADRLDNTGRAERARAEASAAARAERERVAEEARKAKKIKKAKKKPASEMRQASQDATTARAMRRMAELDQMEDAGPAPKAQRVKKPKRAPSKPKVEPRRWQTNLVPNNEIQVKSELADYDKAVKHLHEAKGEIAEIPDEVFVQAVVDEELRLPPDTANPDGRLIDKNDLFNGQAGIYRGEVLENRRFKLKLIKDSHRGEVWHVYQVDDKETGKQYFMKASQYGNNDGVLEMIGGDFQRLVGFAGNDDEGHIRVGNMIRPGVNPRGKPIRWSFFRHVADYQKPDLRERGKWKEAAAVAGRDYDLPNKINERDLAGLIVMDYLLDNEDRHAGNFMVAKEGDEYRLAPIDNGLLFGGRLGEGRQMVPNKQDYIDRANARGAYSPRQYKANSYNNIFKLYSGANTPQERKDRIKNHAEELMRNINRLNVDDFFDVNRLQRRGAQLTAGEQDHLQAVRMVFEQRLDYLRRNGVESLIAAL